MNVKLFARNSTNFAFHAKNSIKYKKRLFNIILISTFNLK